MLADALEHLVRGIVDRPEDVKVRLRTQRHRETLEVRRCGRTAKSIRLVMDAISDGEPMRIDIIDTDKKRR